MDIIEVILASMCIATLLTAFFTVGIVLAFRRTLREVDEEDIPFKRFVNKD